MVSDKFRGVVVMTDNPLFCRFHGKGPVNILKRGKDTRPEYRRVACHVIPSDLKMEMGGISRIFVSLPDT